MSANKYLKIKVLSPTRPLVDVEAAALSVPATMGYMEVLPDHAPLIAELDTGRMVLKKSDGSILNFFVSGGYVDVLNNEVKVLVDIAELPAEINRNRAEQALARATERLTNVTQLGIDIARAQYAQKRATARIEVSGAPR